MDNPFPAYKGNDPYTFVCYSHEDSEVVYKELAWLNERGINLWYDEGVTAGDNWRATIGESLLGSSKVLFFISEHSLKSQHCVGEVSLALDEAKQVIPIYLDDTELTIDLKLGLNTVHALYLSRSGFRNQLIEALGQLPSEKETVVPQKGSHIPALLISVAAIALLLGVWFYSSDESEPGLATFDRSVAIRTFESLNPDPERVAFTNGLQREVVGLLAGYQELSTTTLDDLSNNEGIKPNYLVDVRLQYSGDQVRSMVQLTRRADGKQIWSQRLDRKLDNQLTLQTEIATTISRSLRAQLIGDHQCESLRRRIQSTVAADHVCGH